MPVPLNWDNANITWDDSNITWDQLSYTVDSGGGQGGGSGDGGGGGAATSINLLAAAANPKAASGDGVSMTAHSLPDLIAADKYERAKAAGRSKSRGIRFARFVPPGTTSSNEDAR